MKMKENIPPEMPPASPDLTATETCTNELTRSNSDSYSLTVENSKDTFHQNANARTGKCTAWTDEKHNLYLDHLEASFVKQLHRSMGLLAWCSEQNRGDLNSSRKLPANTCNVSEQFTVLREGCWQKINFERNQPPLDTSAESNVTKSPWIRHFRCADKRCTIKSDDQQEYNTLRTGGVHLRGKRTFSHGLATSSEQIPISHQWHRDSVDSISEVSDQNFVDEDQEDKSSSSSMAKRLKIAVADASSQDQIVPSGKYMTEISTVSNTSSGTEDQICHEWPSENLKSFVCPESAVKSFLGES